MATKLCKYCKTEIDKDAKICPNCKKKQGGKAKWIITGVVVLFVLYAIGSNSSKDSSSTSSTPTDSPAASVSEDNAGDSSAPQATESAPIEYTACTVDELMDALDNNAAGASAKYKDQYLEVTGRLAVIDSDLKYIALYPSNDFALTGIRCYIKDDAQKDAVLNMTKDQQVTLRGKCTSVGEVMGYSLDIDSIG